MFVANDLYMTHNSIIFPWFLHFNPFLGFVYKIQRFFHDHESDMNFNDNDLLISVGSLFDEIVID